MSNTFLRINWGFLFFLLAGCTFSVSATDPLHLTVEVAPSFMPDEGPDMNSQPETNPAVATTNQQPLLPQRYIALNSVVSGSPVSATAVLTTQQFLIARNVITPFQSIGLFTPQGKIKLAMAHVISTGESVTQTLLTDSEWVLFVPNDFGLSIQSWEQIWITPSVRSNAQASLYLSETRYSLRHRVREVVPFNSQATAQDVHNTMGSVLAEWSVGHSGQTLWVDLLVTEEEFPDGKTGLVLRRFVDRGAEPAPENEQVYYCTVQLACSSADSVGEQIVCWWNGC
jgi:hypothetical protein